MKKLILLVEDNPSDEKLTLLAFKNCGVPNEIVVQRDGASALDYLVGTALFALPSLVLLDLKLPKVDGIDVLRRIREDPRTRLLPVVVLTSSKQDDDVIQSYAAGANAYVRKSVDFAVFAEAARTLAQFWLVVNEPWPIPRGAA
jgi:two-component system response regulator